MRRVGCFATSRWYQHAAGVGMECHVAQDEGAYARGRLLIANTRNYACKP